MYIVYALVLYDNIHPESEAHIAPDTQIDTHAHACKHARMHTHMHTAGRQQFQRSVFIQLSAKVMVCAVPLPTGSSGLDSKLSLTIELNHCISLIEQSNIKGTKLYTNIVGL